MCYNIGMDIILTTRQRYYAKNRDHLIEVASRWQRENKGSQRELTKRRQLGLRWYKETYGCKDCGIKNWKVLEFDHVPGWGTTPNKPINSGMSRVRVWEEIQKCEIVCANCHSIRTHNRRLDKLGEL